MLLRAMGPFMSHPRVVEIVIALPEASVSSPPSWLTDGMDQRVRLVVGGETRAHSVRAALGALDASCTVVLVHDAARPFVSAETVESVVAVAEHSGALPAVPVADTIKRGDESTMVVVETVDRSGLWRAQTPQGCPREMLEQAFVEAERTGLENFTDESALLEAAGFRVELVRDNAANFKVTTEHDFAIAEALLLR
jgi:2-C-methyl-D-erythritol 4-phosphate cytidylyltransferase/2-C-methyl-D-erythritol 2,4-cyclodiphosphate synthase